MIHAANILLELGVKNILVKGGHLETQKCMNDVFCKQKMKLIIFKNIKESKPKILTELVVRSLSSAIATFFCVWKNL